MPEMYLRQPGIRYSRCGPFTKNKERIQKFKEAGDSRYIYQNEQEKGWIQHDVASGDFKDFPNQTVSDFYLIKHLTRPKIQDIMDIKVELLQFFINVSIKRLQMLQIKVESFDVSSSTYID